MKKAMPILAVALLGLGVCSGVLAADVGGTIWFDTTENYPAPCALVYLYSDTLCGPPWIDTTTAVTGGEYVFTGLPSGNYGLRANWLGPCQYCPDPEGTECNPGFWSECGKFTVIDEDCRVDLHLDIDCRCE